MAITSNDAYVASAKQELIIQKSASTVASARWYTTRHLSGNPGATAALTTAGSATTGSVWTDATTGFPTINAFGGGASGYLTGVEFGSTVACRLAIDDILWISPNINLLTVATTTFSSQPSFSSRIPNGTDYKGLKIFLEVASHTTAFTASNTFIVTYTNQDGTTGRSTGSFALSATLATTSPGSWFELPLQAGDTGVQKIESIQVTSAGAGATVFTGNVIIARNLWTGRVKMANDGDSHDPYKCGFVDCYADMALAVRCSVDSTNTGIPELFIQIANG